MQASRRWEYSRNWEKTERANAVAAGVRVEPVGWTKRVTYYFLAVTIYKHTAHTNLW